MKRLAQALPARSRSSCERVDRRVLSWGLSLTLGAISCGAWAQSIRTDGSLGPAQTLAGPNYLIPQSLGKQAGGNLFHSFQTFNIAPGESATFTTSSAGIENVISRVTGGSPSILNGRLSLSAAEGGKPAFYFINPAGVVFGAGAAIDVPGAFHAGTADYVKFPDGAFHADLSRTSTFSVAAPEAFGFLGTQRSALSVKAGAALTAAPGQAISLAAGDIVIDNARVASQEGDLRVAAVGQMAVELPFAGAMGANLGGQLTLVNGGLIATAPGSLGSAGSVQVGAGSLGIDGQANAGQTGIVSQSNAGSPANAGDVSVAVAGRLSIASHGEISSSSFSAGRAGTVAVSAGSLSIEGRAGSSSFTGIASNANSSGAAGKIVVEAGSLAIDGRATNQATGIFSHAVAGSTGNSGDIEVKVDGRLSIINGGAISSSTFAAGRAGTVDIEAGSLSIDRQAANAFTGIVSNAADGSTGDAGLVDVAVEGQLSIVSGGAISSDTLGRGQGGTVHVEADSLTIDGRGNASAATISSRAAKGSGNAGKVQVVVANELDVLGGGIISSSTLTSGRGGTVEVHAGSLTADGQGVKKFTGITGRANPGSTGDAGTVTVTVDGQITLINGGGISSSTFALGRAGSVSVQAGSLYADRQGSDQQTGVFSQVAPNSTGNAGDVEVDVKGALTLVNGGSISSSTYSAGNAGTVRVRADSLTIDGQGYGGLTGILSNALEGSTGNAGDVRVEVEGKLAMANGGQIASSTAAAGHAGTVQVDAANLSLDSGGMISAQATSRSAGQTGQVLVTAEESISVSNGAKLSIENSATVLDPGSLSPTRLSVSAPSIVLAHGGQITSSSSGNIAASAIDIHFQDALRLDSASITTSANRGNGGAISIQGGDVVRLGDSQITTSVAGLAGNGGNISIAARSLLLETGFIQANTAARPGVGGTIVIDVQNLLPSGNSLLLGGSSPFRFAPGVFGFNVIQAAAPGGESGSIEVTAPQLDLAGKLGGLMVARVETGGLARQPCQRGGASSLAQSGRGGLPLAARGFIRVEGEVRAAGEISASSPATEALRLAQAGGCH